MIANNYCTTITHVVIFYYSSGMEGTHLYPSSFVNLKKYLIEYKSGVLKFMFRKDLFGCIYCTHVFYFRTPNQEHSYSVFQTREIFIFGVPDTSRTFTSVVADKSTYIFRSGIPNKSRYTHIPYSRQEQVSACPVFQTGVDIFKCGVPDKSRYVYSYSLFQTRVGIFISLNNI